VSWISLDHEAANVIQTDGAASGAEAEFSRVIVLDPGSQAWGQDSCSYSCSDFCFGCVVDVSAGDLRFVSDSSRGRGRILADHHPWALREEGEVAYPLLGLLAPFASCPPRDALICPSPSSQPPTSPFELATFPAPPLASSLVRPSQ